MEKKKTSTIRNLIKVVILGVIIVLTLLVGDLGEYLEYYRGNCVNLGKTVQLLGTDTREVVTAVDIDPEFGLVVRGEDGREKVVRSGEVSVRGMYGYVE